MTFTTEFEEVLRREAPSVNETISFEQLYEESLSFVWRSVRRLGIPEELVDDVVQDVFVIAYRRLPFIEQPSSRRAWIFGILRRVVRDRRRTYFRTRPQDDISVDNVVSTSIDSPLERLEKRQASSLVHELLAHLDDEKREVFVLAELEEMTAPEISQATGVNLNTVYARLRAARQEFKQALLPWNSRQARRLP